MSKTVRTKNEILQNGAGSPDELDQYIKTTTPSLWIVLTAIIILLAGILTWGFFGTIESAATVGCRVENKTAVCYVPEKNIDQLKGNNILVLNGRDYEVISVAGPFQSNGDANNYILYASNIKEGDWYYEARANTNLDDGEMKGRIVFERMSPATFIIN